MTHTYPLQWPMGWPRTEPAERMWGSFKVPYDKTVRELSAELEKLGADSAYLSTDQPVRMDGSPRRDRRADSEHAALYFVRNGKTLCIPCDKFMTVRDNVRAIMLTIESIRRMERYGTSQMVEAALAGFDRALPASVIVTPYMAKPWHEVLGVNQDAPQEVIMGAYRALIKKYHPDNPDTGDAQMFEQVQKAYKEAT